MRCTIKRFGQLCLLGALIFVGPVSDAAQPDVRIEGDPAAGAVVAADHPAAADAAWSVLRADGSAADAAIAAALMLSVVMPETASLAGAGAALSYEADGRHIVAYVGREVSGAAVNPSWLKAEPGKRAPRLSGGQSVGAPTLMNMLGKLHNAQGRLEWRDLTADAARQARIGIALSERAVKSFRLAYPPKHGGAYRLLGAGAEAPEAIGRIVRNPNLASVLDAIGTDGPDVLAGGTVGKSIIQAVGGSRRRPAELTLDDLAAEAIEAPPLCVALAFAGLCATPAPTLGGAVLETAALFAAALPEAPKAIHWANLMAQSHRAAMQNADRYLGDPLRFPDMTPHVLAPARLARRGRRILPERNPGLPGATRVGEAPRGLVAAKARRHTPPTAGVVVVDRRGDAVALTLTLSRPFGAGLVARGIFLNAANGGFDPAPDREGFHRANAIQANKRPRLDLAPVMALDQDRRLILAAVSAGGDRAPAYLAKAVVARLRMGRTPAAAVSAPNIASFGRITELERRTRAERLDGGLKDIGHQPRLAPMNSALLMIARTPEGFVGVADKRGDGVVRSAPPASKRPLDSQKRGS